MKAAIAVVEAATGIAIAVYLARTKAAHVALARHFITVSTDHPTLVGSHVFFS